MAGLLCYCYFFNPVLAQQTAPDDPNNAVTGEQYITPNLVDDPLSWSGPQSQGDCTYRSSGHGTHGNDQRHYQGDWYSNPAYRSCPQISSDGTMRFGWRPEEDMALTNNIDDAHPIIAPYATALAEAGIMVNGYNYSWRIKSADVNNMQNTLSKGPYDKEGYGYSQDLLSITVEFIGQENQDVVWSKEYEYNYRIENWTEFSGSEAFELNGTDFEKIRITVDGYDAGYWGGYFGPEVSNVQFQLIFTVVETDTCDEDPLSSPTCYGYQDAFNKSIGLPTQAEMLAELESEYGATDTTSQSEVTSFFDGGTPDGTSFEYNEEIEAAIEAEIQVFEQEQLDQQSGITEEQTAQQTGSTVDGGQSTGVSQEETTSVSEEESTGGQDPEEETTTEKSTEEATAITSEETPRTTTSNVNALAVAQGAEAAGNAVAGSAVALATDAATTSLNGDVATSTALNQQSQQESIEALDSATETAINDSSNQNAGGSTTSSSNEIAADLDFSSNTSGGVVSSDNLSNINTGSAETINDFGGSTSNLNDYSSNNDGSSAGGDASFTETENVLTSLNDYALNSNDAKSDVSNSLEFDNIASNNVTDGSVDTSIANDMSSSGQQLSDLQLGIEAASENGQSVFAAEFELASLDQNVLDDIINNVINTMLLMQNAAEDNFKEDTSDEGQLTAEEEDALVAAAQSGDDSEDAQAALLGYNPNFRAYQQPQMQGGEIYSDQGVYENQKTYDNPSAGLFNSASDATHREMVRQQYERGQ